MASNFQEFITKVTLNSEEAQKQLDILMERTKEYRKLRDAAAKAGDKNAMEKYAKEVNELDKAMRRYRTASQNVAQTLKNLSGATLAELKKAQKSLNREMQNTPRHTEYYKELQESLEAVKREMRGVKDEAKEAGEEGKKFSDFISNTFSNFAALQLSGLFNGFAGEIKTMVFESTELAKSAEGIKMAFDRINQPGLLDNLRQATHGTVNDIELMKQAVKFKDFNLPVEQLGTYLAFAQQKAKDTGESIDYLVNSIVTGLGRQSPMILDNLGLSAKQISDEAKKSGDFFGAVAKIVEQNMAQAGEYVETAAERSVQASVRLQNEQARLGEALLPLRERIEQTYGTLQLKTLQAVKWLFTNRKEVLEVVKAFARYAAEGAIIIGVINAMTIKEKALTAAIALKTAAVKALTLAERAWVAIAATTRSALLALNLAWTLCTKGVQAYTVALRAATIAGMKNPWTALATVILTVGVAVYELTRALKSNSVEAAKASQATREFTAQQRAMQEVNREADASVAEQVTRFKQLRKTLEDNNAKLENRKKALAEIKAIVPEYHGQLSSEGRLINNNTAALDGYINNLIRAARARAAFNKMVALQENSLGHEQLLNDRQANQQWVENQMKKAGITGNTKVVPAGTWGGYRIVDESGKTEKFISTEEGRRLVGLQKLYDYNNRRIAQEKQSLSLNAKISEKLQEQVKADEKLSGSVGSGSATTPASGSYSSGSGSGKTGKSGNSGNTNNKEETERQQKMRKEIDDQKTLTDQLLALNTLQYQKGEISYREYIDEQHRITIEGLQAQQDIYERYGDNHKQLEAKMAEESMKAQDDANKFKLDDLERAYRQQQLTIEAAAQDRDSYLYQNERAVDDLLFQAEMEYMQRKLTLTREGSEERAALEFEIREKQAQRQLQMQQQWQDLEQQYREQYLVTSNAELQRIALEGLDELHQRGLLSQEEYEQARLGIIAQYAQNETALRNEQFDKNVSAAIQRARSEATGGYDKSKGMSLSNNPIMGRINQYKSMMEQLQQMREQDEISHQEYEQAKAETTAEFLQETVATAQAAYDSINNIMQAAAAYSAACAQLETTQIQKEYDRKIEAAGKNAKKRERLEKERDKKIAAAKTKQNKKAMKIELAQAFASTAMAAINAYASAAKIPYVGHILGPIAAAMATAAGMMQIATIKKQHQAEEAGYYEGGFTGGSDYRRRAGVVHEGEFVANHQAVGNANLAPLFGMLDRAQQNNTVGSLSAEDVSRELGRGQTAVVAPVVNVNTDNEAVNATLNQLSATIADLQQQLANGIEAYSVIDGPNGSYRKTKEYEKLIR